MTMYTVAYIKSDQIGFYINTLIIIVYQSASNICHTFVLPSTSSGHGMSWKTYTRRYLTQGSAATTNTTHQAVQGDYEEEESAAALRSLPKEDDLLRGFGSLWGDPLLITDETVTVNGDGKRAAKGGDGVNGDNAELEEEVDSKEETGVITVDYNEDSEDNDDEDATPAYPAVVFYDGDGDGDNNEDRDEEDDDGEEENEEELPSSGGPGGMTKKKTKRFSDDLAETCLMRCRLCGQETIPKSFHKHLEMRHRLSKAEYGPLTYVRKTFHRCHLCGAVMNFTRDSIGGHCRKVGLVLYCLSKLIRNLAFGGFSLIDFYKLSSRCVIFISIRWSIKNFLI